MNHVRLGATAAAVLMAMVAVVAVGAPASAAPPTCNDYAVYDTARPWPDHEGWFVPAYLPAYQTTGPATSTCQLRRGNTGKPVELLQDTLNSCFGLSEVLEEDGQFGPRTEAMLREAQYLVSTKVDGTYGPLTRDAFSNKFRWVTYDPYNGPRTCQKVYGLP